MGTKNLNWTEQKWVSLPYSAQLSLLHQKNPHFLPVRLFADKDFKEIELQATSDPNHPWRKALKNVLSEDKIYQQMVGWPIKAALRVFGWFTLDLLLYGGRTIFNF